MAPLNHLTGGLLHTLTIFGVILAIGAALSLLFLLHAERAAPAF